MHGAQSAPLGPPLQLDFVVVGWAHGSPLAMGCGAGKQAVAEPVKITDHGLSYSAGSTQSFKNKSRRTSANTKSRRPSAEDTDMGMSLSPLSTQIDGVSRDDYQRRKHRSKSTAHTQHAFEQY